LEADPSQGNTTDAASPIGQISRGHSRILLSTECAKQGLTVLVIVISLRRNCPEAPLGQMQREGDMPDDDLKQILERLYGHPVSQPFFDFVRRAMNASFPESSIEWVAPEIMERMVAEFALCPFLNFPQHRIQ
jgi:hypothetical protein